MKKRNNMFLGILLLVIGGLFLLQTLGVISGIFFDGWWTLFLIVPGLYSMYKSGVSVGNIILVVLGVVFLLNEQGINLKGYLAPAILIALGILVLFKK